MTAPTSELGYVNNAPGYWIGYFDTEHVPELTFPLSVLVYDRMRRSDPAVQSVLRAVCLPIRKTGWRVDPNGSRPEVHELLAEDLGLTVVGVDPVPLARTRDRFSWREHLRLALLSLAYGFMPFEQVYRIDPQGRVRLRKLAPRMPRTIERLEVARDGGLVSVKQWGAEPIPVERAVVYVSEREGGNWYGQSLLRAAYKPWMLKDPALRVWAQAIERNGMGVPIYEAGEHDDPDSVRKGEDLAKSFRSGATAGGAVPYGAKLSLLGVQGQLLDPEKNVRYQDEQIAKAVLAHVLNLGQATGTGSYALGSVLADVLTQSLQAMAQDIADVATQHIVEDWVDLNFGPDEPAPRIVFDEIGGQSIAAALKILVDAGLLFPDRAIEEQMRQLYGLPPKTPVPA